ncbi:hypothetical protein ACWIG5_36580 [Streptomyces lydicus]
MSPGPEPDGRQYGDIVTIGDSSQELCGGACAIYGSQVSVNQADEGRYPRPG